jgi:hypothetical protein
MSAAWLRRLSMIFSRARFVLAACQPLARDASDVARLESRAVAILGTLSLLAQGKCAVILIKTRRTRMHSPT